MKRGSFIDDFTLDTFFAQYPKSPILNRPTQTNATAPLNTYPNNFNDISKTTKSSANYKCQVCNVDLNSKALKRFLHVHHMDGEKSNNRPSNLKALCIYCHANQPNHGHLKALPEYKVFMTILPKLSIN